MLIQLNIKNIALIDELTIEFKPNMNCLTGETGAGKSIIIDSISCVLGGRTSRDTIRTGSDSASVEGVFFVNESIVSEKLSEIGIEEEEDHTLLLYREITQSGRNICKINGKTVTLSMLKSLGEVLIDIHGQHDNQSLMRVETHIKLLDMYSGQDMEKILEAYTVKLQKFKEIHNAIKRITGDPAERARTIDLLTYQVDEINNAKLVIKEDDELEAKKMILSNMEKIATCLNQTYDYILNAEDCVYDKLESACKSMHNISRFAKTYEEILSKLEDLVYTVDDIATSIRNEKDNNEYDAEQIELIDERLDMINRLKRKYGGTIEDILKYKFDAEEKLNNLLGSEEKLEEYNKELKTVSIELLTYCKEMNSFRKKSSISLSKNISNQLHDLEMKNAQFEVKVDFDEGANFHKNGLDQVEFLISPNPGEPTKSLAKIASGGELSRVMLAIKTILADVDNIPTMIFDEIDIGISGQAARKVGEKMKHISKRHQVICVTHLAQIAAMADNNIYISKSSTKDSTKTHATTLSYDEKIKEVGRLLDGNGNSEITLSHAKAMIDEFK